MGDPVSWLVVERGWLVVPADGKEIGRVDAVLGDTDLDIFDGIVISTGLLGRRLYAPAEKVAAITDGRVELAFSAAEAERLDEYKPAEPKS